MSDNGKQPAMNDHWLAKWWSDRWNLVNDKCKLLVKGGGIPEKLAGWPVRDGRVVVVKIGDDW